MTIFPDPRRPTALVVDDDAMLRLDVSEILENAGFRTLEAVSGDEAVTVLETHHLDVTLLFSDVEMPGHRNGFALAREVARHLDRRRVGQGASRPRRSARRRAVHR